MGGASEQAERALALAGVRRGPWDKILHCCRRETVPQTWLGCSTSCSVRLCLDSPKFPILERSWQRSEVAVDGEQAFSRKSYKTKITKVCVYIIKRQLLSPHSSPWGGEGGGE